MLASWAMKSSYEMISARMKPRWMSLWMAPARFLGRLAAPDGPGPHLVGARGEEADETQLLERRLSHHVGGRAGQTEGRRVLRLLLDGELRDLEGVGEGEGEHPAAASGTFERRRCRAQRRIRC